MDNKSRSNILLTDNTIGYKGETGGKGAGHNL